MNFRFTTVETSLNRAEFRLKWLRLLERTFALGCVLCALLLAFGGAILLGWITSRSAGVAFFALLAVAGFIAWLVVLIGALAANPARPWLAASVERADTRLLDRLNTLLFLETSGGDARSEGFAVRIARQLHRLVSEKPSPSPFAGRRALGWTLAFLLSLTGTVLLYRLASPWSRLIVASKAPPLAHPDKPLELALPATNTVEQNQAWGEVRITDPGSDMKVTKVDVVPLQIEAAANQPLATVNWYSTINGEQESSHDLPAPKEPRYAAYQPTLYLDELQLSDWDVLTYYARAKTEKDNAFASEVYFLEVRPFREDLLKMPGGEGGSAYQCLNELTALIGRQQHVIRQTHQHVQQPPELENLRTQDRRKLAEAEEDLRDAAQHLYAKMASKMENKPIGDALDNLAKAQQTLERARRQLASNLLNEGQKAERGGLSELVAARKAFQKAVSEHPEAFDEPKEEEPPPVADEQQKLNQISEFRNEAKAAQQFVQKSLEQQRSLEQQVKATPHADHPRLADQEQQLQKALDDFKSQHPQAFKRTTSELQNAQQALSDATDALRDATPDDKKRTEAGTQQLRALKEALANQATAQQLADAYKLKRMLEQQARTFDQRSKGPENVNDETLEKTVSQAKETVNELKQVAEQEPTRDAFGDPLRDALSGQNKLDLDSTLGRLERARRLQDVLDEPSKQQRASDARDALAKVTQAFEASQPKALQAAQKGDSLKPGDGESLSLGLAELQSLLNQMQNQRPISPQDQAKQGQQALLNLQTGLRSLYGDNSQADQILLHLDELLKGETPLDIDKLKKLMEEIQHFSIETADGLLKKAATPELTNIDPSRLPPAYRGRIQKYFQRLSEK
jgi:hypothetical protein